MDSITLQCQNENQEKVQEDNQKVPKNDEIKFERVKSRSKKSTKMIESNLSKENVIEDQAQRLESVIVIEKNIAKVVDNKGKPSKVKPYQHPH